MILSSKPVKRRSCLRMSSGSKPPKVNEVCRHVRSKNGGPFWITQDVSFRDQAAFDSFANSPLPARTRSGSPVIDRDRARVRLIAEALSPSRRAAPVTLPSVSKTSRAGRRFRSTPSMSAHRFLEPTWRRAQLHCAACASGAGGTHCTHFVNAPTTDTHERFKMILRAVISPGRRIARPRPCDGRGIREAETAGSAPSGAAP